MPRIFVYDGREFDDPDPHNSVDEVRLYLTHFYGDHGGLEGEVELLPGTLEGQVGQLGSTSTVLPARFCQPVSDGGQRFLRAATSPPA